MMLYGMHACTCDVADDMDEERERVVLVQCTYVKRVKKGRESRQKRRTNIWHHIWLQGENVSRIP